MEPTSETLAGGSENTNAKGDSVPESTTKNVLETEILSSDSDSSDFDRQYTCDICEKDFSGLKPLKQHQKSGKHLKAIRKQKLMKDMEEEDPDDDSSDEDFSLDRSKIYAECEVCCKEFNGPDSYRQHVRSKRHKKKVVNSKILEKSKEEGKIDVEKLKKILKADSDALEATVASESSESDVDTPSNVFECEVCEKVFNGLEPFREHMSSKTHKKSLKQKKMMQKLTTFDPGNTIEIVDGELFCKLCRMSFSGPENALAHLKSKGHLDWLEFKKWKKERKNSEKKEDPESIAEASSSAQPTGKSSLSAEKEKPLEITGPDELAKTAKSSENQENESKTLQARNSYKKYKEYNI